jgi:hypothetical protein
MKPDPNRNAALVFASGEPVSNCNTDRNQLMVLI